MSAPALGWVTKLLMVTLAVLMAFAGAVAWLLERRADYQAREDALES